MSGDFQDPRSVPEPETAEEWSARAGMAYPGKVLLGSGELVEDVSDVPSSPPARWSPRLVLVLAALFIGIQLLLFATSGNWLNGVLAVLALVALAARVWLDAKKRRANGS